MFKQKTGIETFLKNQKIENIRPNLLFNLLKVEDNPNLQIVKGYQGCGKTTYVNIYSLYKISQVCNRGDKSHVIVYRTNTPDISRDTFLKFLKSNTLFAQSKPEYRNDIGKIPYVLRDGPARNTINFGLNDVRLIFTEEIPESNFLGLGKPIVSHVFTKDRFIDGRLSASDSLSLDKIVCKYRVDCCTERKSFDIVDSPLIFQQYARRTLEKSFLNIRIVNLGFDRVEPLKEINNLISDPYVKVRWLSFIHEQNIEKIIQFLKFHFGWYLNWDYQFSELQDLFLRNQSFEQAYQQWIESLRLAELYSYTPRDIAEIFFKKGQSN